MDDNDDVSRSAYADWLESRRLVAYELKSIRTEVHSIRDRLDEFRADDLPALRTEIALLKFKSSLWGAILGGLSGILVSVAFVASRFVAK
jgi:hypothetical protein